MPKRHIPAGVKEAARAMKWEGVPTKQVARQFGLDVKTVRKLAADITDIDRESLQRIKTAMPGLGLMVAAGHAMNALSRMGDDPDGAVKSTFGMKLAVEAGRLAAPQAEAPGRAVLAFVQNLAVVQAPVQTVSEHSPTVIETTAEPAILALPEASDAGA